MFVKDGVKRSVELDVATDTEFCSGPGNMAGVAGGFVSLTDSTETALFQVRWFGSRFGNVDLCRMDEERSTQFKRAELPE